MDKELEHSINLLQENDTNVRDSAHEVLSRLCEKLLKHPKEKKYRQIFLNDPTVIDKLLPALGAIECLFNIGFVESDDCLLLPENASLEKVKILRNALPIKSITRPLIDGKNKQFLDRVVGLHNDVMQYEDKGLQEKARKLIPISRLEIATVNRLRNLQKNIKINSSNEEESKLMEDKISMKDLFLFELLYWFKYEFFKWVNSPMCDICSKECKFECVIPSVNPNCSRIEIHRCNTCNNTVQFPRYTHPDPLLSTRCGRCGEWANVFTLLCRSLGYDARLINDETDHVWTEVWSDAENRWIHVDSCENTLDRPLMYEKGWKKKLSYVIAFSKDEVQDVTWRYTQNMESVMQRRILCSETKLLHTIMFLNQARQLQPNYSTARRNYVLKRKIKELASMLVSPNHKPNDKDEKYDSRTSGSYAWRLARGEIAQTTESDYIWNLSECKETFELQYFIVKDMYKMRKDGDLITKEIVGWQNGINAQEGGVFRKVEDDWKMVYLVRAPESTTGSLTWAFEVKDTIKCIETFQFNAKIETFHNASVLWEIEGIFNMGNEKKSTILRISDCKNFKSDKLNGVSKLNLKATFFGGQGEIAWQHAQLFRESLNNLNANSMTIIIKLRSIQD